RPRVGVRGDVAPGYADGGAAVVAWYHDPMSADDAVLKVVRDPDRGHRNLVALARHLGEPAFGELCPVLARLLSRTADPDMALNNLERLFVQPAARRQLPELLESRSRGLDAVLQLLATSQFFADTLAAYPEFLEQVRNPPRRTPPAPARTTDLPSQRE